MWDNPDVFKHVTEYTDFRMGKLIDNITFKSNNIDVGDYKYVYAGQYTQIYCPDISADKLMSRTKELVEKSEQFKFIPEADYKSSILSYMKYNNVLMYQMILLVNELATNSEFNSDNLKDINILPYDDINDLILNVTNTNAKTVKSVTVLEQYEELMEFERETLEDPDVNIEEWLSIKIPLLNFENIKESPEYNRLKSELGDAVLIKYITKMDKYKKKSIPSEDGDYDV